MKGIREIEIVDEKEGFLRTRMWAYLCNQSESQFAKPSTVQRRPLQAPSPLSRVVEK